VGLPTGAGDDGLLTDQFRTSDGLKLSFFRPLSSALFALDHAIAGRRPLPYHLQSLAWYVAAALSAVRLFRRLLPEREAALAALLFVVSPAHWMLAAWPSARHVAVSGFFAIHALSFHLAAREGPSPRCRFDGLGALGCAALLSCRRGWASKRSSNTSADRWGFDSQRRPPEAMSVSPVSQRDSLVAKNTAISAISSGWPMRPNGT